RAHDPARVPRPGRSGAERLPRDEARAGRAGPGVPGHPLSPGARPGRAPVPAATEPGPRRRCPPGVCPLGPARYARGVGGRALPRDAHGADAPAARPGPKAASGPYAAGQGDPPHQADGGLRRPMRLRTRRRVAWPLAPAALLLGLALPWWGCGTGGP